MDSRTLWDVFQDVGCSLDGLRREDVNWLSEEPSMKHFTTWFQEHISSDNVLGPGEFEEFERLCAAGGDLHGDALNEALIKAGVPIDELPIEDFDLHEEKDEINTIKEQIDILAKIEEQLLTSIKQCEEAEVMLQKELHDKQITSFKDGQALMKTSVRVKSSLSNFYQSLQKLSSICLSYKTAEEPYHFLAQAPLEDFHAQCEIFKQNMKLFMKRQFDQKEQHVINDYFAEQEQPVTMNIDKMHGDFKVHPQRLWEADISRVCALAKLKGVTAALENMTLTGKALVDPTAISSLRLHSARWQEESSALATEMEILRQHELSTAAQNYVVFKIAEMAHNVSRQRCIRRQYRLSKLQGLQEKVDRQSLLTDVLWTLLRREGKLVNMAGQFLDDAVAFLHQEYAKHQNVMGLHKEIEERNAMLMKALSNGEIPLVSNMSRLLNLKEPNNVPSLVDALTSLQKQLADVNENENENAFLGGRLDPELAMEKDLKTLQETLASGPTKQISMVPADIVHEIHTANMKLQQLENELDHLHRDFSSKQVYFSKFPVERNSRLLWAWFLANPSKLLTAMKCVERELQNQGRKEGRKLQCP